MRLLVLGGTHHVGRAMVETALSLGHDVTTVNRGSIPAPALVDLSPRVPTPEDLVRQDPARTRSFGVADEETG